MAQINLEKKQTHNMENRLVFKKDGEGVGQARSS